MGHFPLRPAGWPLGRVAHQGGAGGDPVCGVQHGRVMTLFAPVGLCSPILHFESRELATIGSTTGPQSRNTAPAAGVRNRGFWGCQSGVGFVRSRVGSNRSRQRAPLMNCKGMVTWKNWRDMHKIGEYTHAFWESSNSGPKKGPKRPFLAVFGLFFTSFVKISGDAPVTFSNNHQK